MTIHGVGVDLVEVRRWERLARRPTILHRWFDDGERARCLREHVPAAALAQAFAAKEAVFKALAPAGWDGSVPWACIHVDGTSVQVSGRLADAAAGVRVQVRAVVSGAGTVACAVATAVTEVASDAGDTASVVAYRPTAGPPTLTRAR